MNIVRLWLQGVEMPRSALELARDSAADRVSESILEYADAYIDGPWAVAIAEMNSIRASAEYDAAKAALDDDEELAQYYLREYDKVEGERYDEMYSV